MPRPGAWTGAGHIHNFLDPVRSRRVEDLNAPMQVGHVTALYCCHLANMSYRLGSRAPLESCREAAQTGDFASEQFEGMLKHLAATEVPPELPWVAWLDPETDTCVWGLTPRRPKSSPGAATASPSCSPSASEARRGARADWPTRCRRDEGACASPAGGLSYPL
jgi:hypothetical protein